MKSDGPGMKPDQHLASPRHSLASVILLISFLLTNSIRFIRFPLLDEVMQEEDQENAMLIIFASAYLTNIIGYALQFM